MTQSKDVDGAQHGSSSWSCQIYAYSRGVSDEKCVKVLTFSIIALVRFLASVSIALQAPFYPAEAHKKGATAAEHGIVFGSYELTTFVMSAISGKLVRRYGPKTMLAWGITISSISITCFGFLTHVNNRTAFVFLSLVLRIFDAIGTSSAAVASFALTCATFPDTVGTVFGAMESFYGAGFISGLAIGGFLHSIGGFKLAFVSVGVLRCVFTIGIISLLPLLSNAKPIMLDGKENRIWKTFKIPAITYNTMAIFFLSICNGFNMATLEPVLVKKFKFSISAVAYMIVIMGITYVFVSPLMGKIVDRCVDPKIIILSGCFVNILSFSIVGPLPFLPFDTNIPGTVIALILAGVGSGMKNVASSSEAYRAAKQIGLPDDLATYGLLSGIWNSAFSIGGFLGLSIAGFFYDYVGFRWAAFIFLIPYLCFTAAYSLFVRKCRKEIPDEEIENEILSSGKIATYVKASSDYNYIE